MSKNDTLKAIADGGTDKEELVQSKEDQQTALYVQSLLRASWDAKNAQQVNELHRKCDRYKQGKQNPRQGEDHPGSVTNIIHPTIESQISDLVASPYSVTAKGWERSDDLYATQAQNLLEFVLYRNQFKTKLNTAEHDRLELGLSIFKTWFDPDAFDGNGLPSFDVVSPANFFPDPKITQAEKIQEAEFIIHAVPRPLSWIRANFPERGKYVQRETTVPYNPTDTFQFAGADETSEVGSQKALLIECYMRDEEGKLYCVHVANDILLDDTRKKETIVQRNDKYPFVVIPCYLRRGSIWGMGDVELLIPTQDIINELDDMIRMNARASGNPQIVVGKGAGERFDPRKWTTKAGLRIPMKDHNAWSIVPPQNISSDIPIRREKAFQEADLVSLRPEVSRGERPTGITAAAAIQSLQQMGQKSVIIKSVLLKEGLARMCELLLDDAMEYWDEEMWIRTLGDKPDWVQINPAEWKEIPIMVDDLVGAQLGLDDVKVLTDEDGEPMAREARFDLQFSLGNGFPVDKSFILQMLIDMAGIQFPEGRLVKYNELREFLKNEVGLPLEDDSAAAETMQDQIGGMPQQFMQQQQPQLNMPQEGIQMPPMPEGGLMP